MSTAATATASNPYAATVIVDTREAAPLPFPLGVHVVRATLATGDYSLAGPAGVNVAVERKSHADAWGSVLAGRARFRAEWVRLGAMVAAGGRAAVLIEGVADMDDLRRVPGGRPGEHGARANSVVGTYRAWSRRYRVPVVCRPSRLAAATWLMQWLLAAPGEIRRATTHDPAAFCLDAEWTLLTQVEVDDPDNPGEYCWEIEGLRLPAGGEAGEA